MLLRRSSRLALLPLLLRARVSLLPLACRRLAPGRRALAAGLLGTSAAGAFAFAAAVAAAVAARFAAAAERAGSAAR